MTTLFTRHRYRNAMLLAAALLLAAVAWVPQPSTASPLGMLARTLVTPVIQPSIGWSDAGTIQSTVAIADDFSITTDADTTVAIRLYGLIPWQIINESGAGATLTFYDALSTDGNELTPYDEDGVAVAAMTIGDDCSRQMPAALSGCTILVIKGAAAGDHFTLVCKR